MEELREAEKKAFAKLKQLKDLDDEALKKGLIEFTEAQRLNLDDWQIIMVDETPLPEHDDFKKKIPDAIALWKDILEKNKGLSQINPNEVIVVPAKIVEVGELLNAISDKESLPKREVIEALNGYKALYESIIKLFQPHFIRLHPEKAYLVWSDIAEELAKLEHYNKKLFKSMNGHLRNAEGHASFVAEDDKIIWMKEDGTRIEYPAKKIIDKSIDLIFVIIALYYGLSEIFASYLVETYKKIPAKELKKAFSGVPLP